MAGDVPEAIRARLASKLARVRQEQMLLLLERAVLRSLAPAPLRTQAAEGCDQRIALRRTAAGAIAESTRLTRSWMELEEERRGCERALRSIDESR